MTFQLNDICISLNKFNSSISGNYSKHRDFYYYYIIVFQYIEEFPIREELELIFSNPQVLRIYYRSNSSQKSTFKF